MANGGYQGDRLEATSDDINSMRGHLKEQSFGEENSTILVTNVIEKSYKLIFSLFCLRTALRSWRGYASSDSERTLIVARMMFPTLCALFSTRKYDNGTGGQNHRLFFLVVDNFKLRTFSEFWSRMI